MQRVKAGIEVVVEWMSDQSAPTTPAEGTTPTKRVINFRIGGPQDDHAVCKRMVEKAKKSIHVKFLTEHLEKLGCHLNLDEAVRCQPCSQEAQGGFIANLGQLKEGEYVPKVVVCENNLLGAKYVSQCLAHELIHAYDQCRANVNWRNCYHLACTEIRASALSGECKWIEEVDRGNFGLRGQHQAKEIIDKVFRKCYLDTAPYDRIP